MEIEIVLISVFCSLLGVYLLNKFQTARKTKKDYKIIIFNYIVAGSAVILVISLLIGGWTGMALGAVALNILIPSLCGLVFARILNRIS